VELDFPNCQVLTNLLFNIRTLKFAWQVPDGRREDLNGPVYSRPVYARIPLFVPTREERKLGYAEGVVDSINPEIISVFELLRGGYTTNTVIKLEFVLYLETIPGVPLKSRRAYLERR